MPDFFFHLKLKTMYIDRNPHTILKTFVEKQTNKNLIHFYL